MFLINFGPFNNFDTWTFYWCFFFLLESLELGFIFRFFQISHKLIKSRSYLFLDPLQYFIQRVINSLVHLDAYATQIFSYYTLSF